MEFFGFEALRSNMESDPFPPPGWTEANLRDLGQAKPPVKDRPLLNPGATGVVEDQATGHPIALDRTVARWPTSLLSVSIRSLEP